MVETACDFEVGEHNVVIPVVSLKTGKVRFEKGMVSNILDARTVKKAGNVVNMVVMIYRNGDLVSTHSNACRKDGKPGLWDQDELTEGGW